MRGSQLKKRTASSSPAGAAVAGAGSAVFGTFFSTAMQQRAPAEALARTTAFSLTGSFALGSVGYVVIGPVAAITGPARLLGFATAWGIVSSAVVLALPAIGSVTWRELRSPPDREAPPSGR